jgi:DNA-binding SARP family transcriptional activator
MPPTSFVITATLALSIYLGLAIYVVTHNPHRTINWVFGAFCLTISAYYLTNFILYSLTEQTLTGTPLLLRVKWAAIVLSPAFYLHLTIFYFPNAWRRYQNWMKILAYLGAIGFALTVLCTNLFISGVLQRLPGQIIGPIPGPLMPAFALFFSFLVSIGTIGLIVGFFRARNSTLKKQVLSMLTPTLLIILSSGVNWVIVLTQDKGNIPHEFGDLIAIVAALFYANAVIHYGSLFDPPLELRDFLYSLIAAVGFLVPLFATITIDGKLMSQFHFPYPLLTSILVMILVTQFSKIRLWIIKLLDPHIFGVDHQPVVVDKAIGNLSLDGAKNGKNQIQNEKHTPILDPRAVGRKFDGSKPRILETQDTPAQPLEIRVLGSLQVCVNGEHVPESAWGSERAKEMLAYLLWKGGDGATRDEITTALWPEYSIENATNVFHVTMNRLRKTLSPGANKARDSKYVIHHLNKYFLNFEAPLWIDEMDFRRLAAGERLEELRQAVELYRGEYLQDAAWALPPEVEIRRRELEKIYENLLVRILSQVNDPEAEIYLEKLLIIDPTNQDANTRLVASYLSRGRKDLAEKHIAPY